MARQALASLVNSAVLPMAFTGYLAIGDTIDVIDVDVDGNILSTIAGGVQVISIDPNVSITVDQVVDTTGATGTAMIEATPIGIGQEAIDRLYRRKVAGADVGFSRQEAILASAINSPSAGKTLLSVADVALLAVGDEVSIVSDAGLLISGATIEAIAINGDATNNRATIQIDQLADTSALTNPKLIATSLSVSGMINRLQADIDMIDRPYKHFDLGVGNKNTTVFRLPRTIIPGTSQFKLDGVEAKLGMAGTRASYTHGAANAALSFRSLILGLAGNATKVAVTTGAGIVVTVSGGFSAGYTVSVSNNAGAATSAQIAAALNANASVQKILQATYGGDGTGTPAALVATSLAGGLDNGTGDYAELEDVVNNATANTGYRVISLRIVPSEKNRYQQPPSANEDMWAHYSAPLYNVDR
jgi:hypothetical protein